MKSTIKFVLTFLIACVFCHGAQAQESEKAPQDLTFAVAVAAAQIMHQPPDVSIANIAGKASAELGKDPFSYNGFSLNSSAILKYERGSTANSRKLNAVLQFTDQFKRGTMTTVSLGYSFTQSELSVDAASLTPVAPPTPRVELYFVPMSKVAAAGQSIYADWSTLYSFVKSNTVPEKQPTERAKHYGFLFCMDRTAPDAKVYPVVSRKRNEKNSSNSIARSTTMNFDGWRVSVIAGRMQLGTSRKFYINVMYKPGSFAPESARSTRKIASYDSSSMTLTADQPTPKSPATVIYPVGGGTLQTAGAMAQATPQPVQSAQAAPAQASKPKSEAPFASVVKQQESATNHAPPPPAVQQTPQQAPPPMAVPAPPPAPPSATPRPAPATMQQAAPAQGPLERGMAFLNPVFPDDVAIIQQRLKTLGHYGGPIDRTFGSFTKKALDNFAVKHGFPKGQWSLGLQKQLFKGTGL